MGFVKIKDLPELEMAKGIKAHAVTTDTISVIHVILDDGAVLPEHSHYHEQVGNVMVLEPNVIHSGRALTACKVIDIFHPLREDFAGSSFGGYPGEKN